MNIQDKCKAVADSFDWYATTAKGYLESDNWTPARVQFVEERFGLLTRVNNGLAKADYPLTIPSNINTSKHQYTWRVVMAASVTGYKCTEYLHLLSLQDHQTSRGNLLLYRTKDTSRKLAQGSTVKGLVRLWVDQVEVDGQEVSRHRKVLFAGREFSVARKVVLK